MPNQLHQSKPQNFLILFLSLLWISAFAQPQQQQVPETVIAAIAKDVWEPFMASYHALDIDQFRSVHSSDLTRVSINMNRIEDNSNYFNNLGGFFQSLKTNGNQIDIKFSVRSTAVSGDKAYQTGYYCFSSRGSDKEAFKPMAYGFFNVLLVKEDGAWKISVDADTHVSLTDAEFRSEGIIYELE